MRRLVTHIKNLAVNAVRESAKRHPLLARAIGEKPRSSQWPRIEHVFKEANPFCAACGDKEKLNVHHMKPFHLHPELELDPTNLITLCMGQLECHLKAGHGGDFKAYNPTIENDALEIRKRPWNRELIYARIKKTRKYQ